jgi:hypothetical protein
MNNFAKNILKMGKLTKKEIDKLREKTEKKREKIVTKNEYSKIRND